MTHSLARCACLLTLTCTLRARSLRALACLFSTRMSVCLALLSPSFFFRLLMMLQMKKLQASHAARYDRFIEPLVSLSLDFYSASLSLRAERASA